MSVSFGDVRSSWRRTGGARGDSGAAQESNLPTGGLRRLTGFEDRLGHQPRAAPVGRVGAKSRARFGQGSRARKRAMSRPSGFPQPILDIDDPEDRRAAAAAAAGGAGVFYAFGNFCALAAAPDAETMRRMNRLKGRPLAQVGSVTTTPDRAALVFDWARLPRTLGRGVIEALMADFRALGPIGFRGPAAHGVPGHLTVDGT